MSTNDNVAKGRKNTECIKYKKNKTIDNQERKEKYVRIESRKESVYYYMEAFRFT